MQLLEVINQKAIALDVEARNKEEAFTYICDMLYADGTIDSPETFKQDLYQRESEGKTGIGNGIAIPHGKSEAVTRTCISVIRLKEPIEWETIDGKPVRMLILFAVRISDMNHYFLKMMAEVAKKLAKEGICEALLNSSTEDEVLKLLC